MYKSLIDLAVYRIKRYTHLCDLLWPRHVGIWTWFWYHK